MLDNHRPNKLCALMILIATSQDSDTANHDLLAKSWRLHHHFTLLHLLTDLLYMLVPVD